MTKRQHTPLPQLTGCSDAVLFEVPRPTCFTIDHRVLTMLRKMYGKKANGESLAKACNKTVRAVFKRGDKITITSLT